MAEAFPLHWPQGWPRTKNPKLSRFDVTLANTRDGLFAEIARLGGRYVVLSSNVPLRLDGLPYANRAEPTDSGVAVYFERKGKQMVFACDQWNRVRDNIRAIEKTIEAMRGIERWGASDMLERAFSAFEALPPPGEPAKREWWDILGIPRQSTADDVKAAYRAKASKAHPDAGGSHDEMAALNAARTAALSSVAA